MYEEAVMSVQQEVLPEATVEEQFVLEALMAEPEAGVSDAPRYVELPNALLALLISPELPKRK
ncbi:hypothetical protein [Saccharothrix syringae]|uniref:Uncharacterized protein n=1 Tax=Saccharothrix syringae TaxID=103733 RepID=A0A5Q0GYU6_SACSY|nr:hypothetical protein [Saccharothrix syringae]QFZ18694.1 hypothetical protein EKG83_15595 [Saccharothrix syringae]